MAPKKSNVLAQSCGYCGFIFANQLGDNRGFSCLHLVRQDSNGAAGNEIVIYVARLSSKRTRVAILASRLNSHPPAQKVSANRLIIDWIIRY